MNIGLVLRTVAHLRPVQVLFQVLRRVHKARFKALVCSSVEVKPMSVEPAAKWQSFDGRRFAFLNLEEEFRGWNNTAHGMLWAYNQNYMDWLCQPGMTAAEGACWIDRFIADIPTNRVGLDPYPIALRAINWVKFFSRFPMESTAARRDSLYSQLRLLERKLEYHLLGNHLLEDAYALYIGSAYLKDRRMQDRACRLLRRQLREQVLPDGAHYEQSPMYHCILLDRLLDCINAGEGAFADLVLKPAAVRMLGHLESIVYADGSIPLLNDSAVGIAPVPADIFAYAHRLGLQWAPVTLGECGYRKFKNADIEAVADVGNIKASYQPGHTHADTFSFELRIDGRPFIVDSGISTYDKTPRRQLERSSLAHNTVVLAGKSSSEVWGGFRVGRRAKVQMLRDGETVVAEHDGFGALGRHRRSFSVDNDGFHIDDHITKPTPATAYLHFAPGVEVAEHTAEKILTSVGTVSVAGADTVEISDGTVSHEYNRFEEVKIAAVHFKENLQITISL